MTVYNAGSINGAESVAEICGVEIESIGEVNQVKVEHVPLDTVIFYNGVISSPTTRTADLASYGLDGWYVCNGKVGGAPDLIDVAPTFLLGYSSVGGSGGSDVRSVISHTHASTPDGSHSGHTCDSEADHHHEVYPYILYRVHFGHAVGSYMSPARLTLTTKSHDHPCSSSGGHDHSGAYGHTIGNSGSLTPNNRPVYRTLIPIIRLDKVQFEFVVGCVLWYDANDISNPSGRTADLSSYDLPGWYVCNNQSGTLDMLDRFVRCEGTPDTTGGTNTAVNVQHNHELNSLGSHNHGIDSRSHNHEVPKQSGDNVWKYGGSTTNNWPSGQFHYGGTITTTTDGEHTHTLDSYTNTHDHSGDSDTSGTGDSDNRPAFYSMLLIERLS